MIDKRPYMIDKRPYMIDKRPFMMNKRPYMVSKRPYMILIAWFLKDLITSENKNIFFEKKKTVKIFASSKEFSCWLDKFVHLF